MCISLVTMFKYKILLLVLDTWVICVCAPYEGGTFPTLNGILIDTLRQYTSAALLRNHAYV